MWQTLLLKMKLHLVLVIDLYNYKAVVKLGLCCRMPYLKKILYQLLLYMYHMLANCLEYRKSLPNLQYVAIFCIHNANYYKPKYSGQNKFNKISISYYRVACNNCIFQVIFSHYSSIYKFNTLYLVMQLFIDLKNVTL